MNFYLTTLDIEGKIDGTVKDQIFTQLNACNIDKADYVALAITHIKGWEFDSKEFERIKHKPFVVFDFTEYGQDVKSLAHIYGENTESYLYRFEEKNFIDLDKALKQVNIKCYFKRELPQNIIINTYYPIYPIEYPALDYCNYNVDTLEEYNNRPIDIFFNWGWSNVSRPKLHAAFYELAEQFNYRIISNHLHLVNEKKENPNGLMVFSSYTPHHSRMDMNSILEIQKISKISVSLNGCGVKCFRHSESPVNSLMALQENELEWTYEWNETNSISLPNEKDSPIIDCRRSIEKLIFLLRESNLYDRYVKGVENNKLYKQKTYINELLKRI